MKRFPVDLSHFDFKCGDIGKLQTLTAIPIVAGDGVSLDMKGIWRLSPLRRNLVVDCCVDLFAFFIPHRHIYGDDWITFIKDGARETVDFATGPTTASHLSYMGSEIVANAEFPLWLSAGYNQIWNRYFRSPTDANTRADTYITGNVNEQEAGFRVGYLPVAWSTGTIDGVATANRAVSTVGDTFDIVDLKRIASAYKTDVDREYFGQRYNDILNVSFGSKVNTDADERPTLVAHKKWWLSGYDVDGTSDASLGTFSGKSAAVGSFGFPRKFFSEHGCLRVMACLRFPTIHSRERPYLHSIEDPSYLQIAGDPDLIGAEPPEQIDGSHYFNEVSTNDLGQAAYGQHYRYHPSQVHKLFYDLNGFTFINTPMSNVDTAQYIIDGEYDETFQTAQLRHWQSHNRIGVSVQRVVPPARRSLYAGVR